MCTARSGWKALSVRNYDKSKLTQIKLDLEDIIEIDPTKMVIESLKQLNKFFHYRILLTIFHGQLF